MARKIARYDGRNSHRYEIECTGRGFFIRDLTTGGYVRDAETGRTFKGSTFADAEALRDTLPA